jgi:CheY-like chemotaxis protein
MEDLLATIRPLAEHKHQALRHHIPEDDRELLIDRGRFKQVLFNLLSNAVKFTPEQGSIEVRADWVAQPHAQAAACTSDVAGGLRVEVEDNGPGIPIEDQEKIWQEFHQTRDRDRTIEGTGLGLSLTKKLTALLGGEVWLRSEPGKGSCFFVVVPVEYVGPIHEAPVPKEPGPVTPVRKPRHKAEVLIIEDHEPTNTLFADWLRDAGLKPASAYNGAEGLEVARRLRPGLILLDLRLPKVDGWQVLHELKNDPVTSDIPVIIISVLDKGEISGSPEVLDWFVKPLDQEHFLRRLRVNYAELFQRPRPLTALIVDDDSAYRKLLSDLLVAEGMEVGESGNGREALVWLEVKVPDLLVVDLVMPEMDGFTLVEAVRADPRLRNVPIVIVTCKEINDEDWGRLNGTIQSLMSKNRLTQELFSQRLVRMGLLDPPDGPDNQGPEG